MRRTNLSVREALELKRRSFRTPSQKTVERGVDRILNLKRNPEYKDILPRELSDLPLIQQSRNLTNEEYERLEEIDGLESNEQTIALNAFNRDVIAAKLRAAQEDALKRFYQTPAYKAFAKEEAEKIEQAIESPPARAVQIPQQSFGWRLLAFVGSIATRVVSWVKKALGQKKAQEQQAPVAVVEEPAASIPSAKPVRSSDTAAILTRTAHPEVRCQLPKKAQLVQQAQAVQQVQPVQQVQAKTKEPGVLARVWAALFSDSRKTAVAPLASTAKAERRVK